jgi:nucleotidyltransferase AbiEii toxin of type IV toxin-antitoxin system
MLKGALALDWRFGLRARTTRDIDLAWQSSAEQIVEDVMLVSSLDLGDYFSFIATHRRTREIDGLTLVQFHLSARLADRRFEETNIDIVIPTQSSIPPVRLLGPDLLGFAGLEPASAPVIALEQHVAEKVHAYVQTFTEGRINTRAKDLVDLVVISHMATFDAHELRLAITSTFAHRALGDIPVVLPSPPDRWRPRYAEMAIAVGIDPELVSGHREASAFLNPVLDGSAGSQSKWNPTLREWTS